MSATQLSLDLRERKTRRRVGPKLAARMMAILAGLEKWTTRRELATYGMNDRECRLGRECSHWRIVQGQRGYKLLRNATPEEIYEARMAFIRQIEAETNQLALLTRRAHEALHRMGSA